MSVDFPGLDGRAADNNRHWYTAHEADPSWRLRAKCRGMDTDLFFPERQEIVQVLEIRDICADCPVATECLEYALVAGEKHGFFGGKSERQRRNERRKRQYAARQAKAVA